MGHIELSVTSCAIVASWALIGCGPSQVHLDPRNVTAVSLKLPSAEPTFCPGKPLSLELRATLKDGSTCSNADPEAACMGRKGALIDARDIRVQGTSGVPSRAEGALLWIPPPDPLITAERGMSLRAWLESSADGAPQRSPVTQLELRPEYSCSRENVFSVPPPNMPGQNGGPGPNLKVAATILATPFYPEVLLVRVEHPGGRKYILSADRTKQVVVLSKGQNGASGAEGQSGNNGPDGADGYAGGCEAGRPGTGGTDGWAGGNAGNGGPGGSIQLMVDEAVIEKVRGWLGVGSHGGDPGAPGMGGLGGQGGRGGQHSNMPNCNASNGTNGTSGARGANGEAGKLGPPGPPAVVTSASKQSIFAGELPLLQQLETAVRPRS